MSTRRAKQLIYGALYGIVWVLVFYVGYFIFLRPVVSAPPVPQCPAEGCPPPGVKPITLQGDVADFQTSVGHHTFLAHVANLNNDFAAQYFTYTFSAYDASGNIIQSVSGQSFAYSNEIKYLIAPNEAIASGTVDHVGITITLVHWVPAADMGIVPQFAFQNIAPNYASGTVSVGGELVNNDIASFAHVQVITIFKGIDGAPIGASATELDNVLVGTTVNFSVIYPNNGEIDPTQNQLVAYGVRS